MIAVPNTFLAIGECMVEMAALGGGMFRQGFAGDTFNAAWHARRALPDHWQVEYFTALGDDPLSTRMLAFMQQQGIATPNVRRIAGKAPGLYTIELDNGERSFTYWRSVSAARHLADDEARLTQAMSGARAILFSGITLAILSDTARRRLLSLLGAAKSRGAVVAFDSNIRMRLWPNADVAKTAIMAGARVATIALPSVDDEVTLFGDTDATAVAKRYHAAGVGEIIVKAGADAALLMGDGGIDHIAPAQRIQPVDTTGAGDSFNGTYIAARLVGNSPRDAAIAAHAVAARVIQQHGALV
jgi:2-dehydro-3-deoxygluconokinase